jgi:hypothetical protein
MKPSASRNVLALAMAVAVLLLSRSASAQMLPAPALQGKKVLLVTGEPSPQHPSDDPLVKRHLESLGFVVTMAKDSDPARRAEGEDLVVISSTVNAHVLQSRYRDAPVPVLTWSTYSYPDMGMTGPHLHTDFEVVDPARYFARSFSMLYGYGLGVTTDIGRAVGLEPRLFGTLYLQPGTVGWGKPAPGGTVIVNFEGKPREAGVFTYEKGATMYGGFVAPARRVGFYLGSDNFHLLTAAYGPALRDPRLRAWYIGRKLFDACLRWAVSRPPAVPPYNPAELRQSLQAAAKGKKLLFVERKDAIEGEEADRHMVEHLKSLGFEITVADQMDPETMAGGENLVVISATCSKYKLANKYSDANVPVLVLEGLDADAMHMAGRNRYVDYGEHGEPRESEDPEENYLDIVAAWNPMAGGLKPGLVEFTKAPGAIKWAVPEPDAIAIAVLPNETEQQAIFGYEKGAVMAGGIIAPARRVLFPLDNEAFDDLTPQGLTLYDAAVLWAIGTPK